MSQKVYTELGAERIMFRFSCILNLNEYLWLSPEEQRKRTYLKLKVFLNNYAGRRTLQF